MNIELKKMHISIPQYEDSIKFHADLIINGKHVGVASNDGNGGDCSYSAKDAAGGKLIKEAEAYFKGLPPLNLAGSGEEPVMMERSLEYYISELSYNYYNQKVLNRQMLRGIVFGQNGIHQWLEFKKPISQFLKNPNGVAFLKQIMENQVIPQMKDGDILFNTNLPPSVIEKLSEKQLLKMPSYKTNPEKPRRSKRL